MGTSSYVNAIATDGTNIYVGGSFISAGGGVVNNIAKWDTTANSGSGGWSPLGSGTFGSVFAIAVSDSGKDVYAGGAFHKVTGCTGTDGADCYRIAKWDTTANSGSGGWSPLGKGTAVGDVFAIAVDSSNNVFVGGDFTSAKGTTSAGDCASCKYIAKWDTTVNSGSGGWLALGSGIVGVDDSVSAIATDGTNIYVGGSFTSAGGV